MKALRPRIAACVLAAFASLARASVAQPAPARNAVPNESVGPYAGTYYSAGTAGLLSNSSRLWVTTETSSTFVNVAGIATKITVPTGKRALLVARFSASSACQGVSGRLCIVRILVDGHPTVPAGEETWFDQVDPAAPDQYIAHANSMDQAYEVGSGQHTVLVQEATDDLTQKTFFWLANCSLTVESAIHP